MAPPAVVVSRYKRWSRARITSRNDVTPGRFRDYLESESLISIGGRRKDSSLHMAKVKNLKKRIRRLEARLQKGAKKLAKLKAKLEAASTASVEKARKSSNATVPMQKKRRSAGDVKPGSTVKEPRVAGKKKRKLNLTPERRAQLAAAMKARWAAKRAAAAANTQRGSSSPGFSSGDASEPQ